VRTLLDNSDLDISNFDYNFRTGVFYLSDDKSNKVVFDENTFLTSNYSLRFIKFIPIGLQRSL
jgi:hypothetical protein